MRIVSIYINSLTNDNLLCTPVFYLYILSVVHHKIKASSWYVKTDMAKKRFLILLITVYHRLYAVLTERLPDHGLIISKEAVCIYIERSSGISPILSKQRISTSHL